MEQILKPKWTTELYSKIVPGKQIYRHVSAIANLTVKYLCSEVQEGRDQKNPNVKYLCSEVQCVQRSRRAGIKRILT